MKGVTISKHNARDWIKFFGGEGVRRDLTLSWSGTCYHFAVINVIAVWIVVAVVWF